MLNFTNDIRVLWKKSIIKSRSAVGQMWRSEHDRTVNMPTWQTEWNLLGCSCWVSLESCHGRPVSGAGVLPRSQWCWDETTWNESKMTCSAKTSRQLRKHLMIKNMRTLLVNVGGKSLTKLLVQLLCFIFIHYCWKVGSVRINYYFYSAIMHKID